MNLTFDPCNEGKLLMIKFLYQKVLITLSLCVKTEKIRKMRKIKGRRGRGKKREEEEQKKQTY